MKSSRRQRELVKFAMDLLDHGGRSWQLPSAAAAAEAEKQMRLYDGNMKELKMKKFSAEKRKADSEIILATAISYLNKFSAVSGQFRRDFREIMLAFKAMKAIKAAEDEIAEANAKIKHHNETLKETLKRINSRA